MGVGASSVCVSSNMMLETPDLLERGSVRLPDGLDARLSSLSIDVDSVNEIMVEGTLTTMSSSPLMDTVGDYTYGDKVLLTRKELDEMHKVNELFFGLQSPLELRITSQKNCSDGYNTDDDQQTCITTSNSHNEDDPRSYIDDNSLQSISYDVTSSNNGTKLIKYLPLKKVSIARSIRKTSSSVLRSLGIKRPLKKANGPSTSDKQEERRDVYVSGSLSS